MAAYTSSQVPDHQKTNGSIHNNTRSHDERPRLAGNFSIPNEENGYNLDSLKKKGEVEEPFEDVEWRFKSEDGFKGSERAGGGDRYL